ncbi:MAG: OB-fold nucleic acid binding domain-containing protein [Chitinophagaceae bacterium]|nr:OB-fold nucleic acid binding domain-containing protein [Chitinophagaceae bacterium]
MKGLITALLLFAAINSFAQADTIKAKNAKKMINKVVIVKAVVAGSKLIEKDGKRTLILSLDKPYPKTPLQVIFFNKALADLNLQSLLDGKIIIVKGTVTLYNDKPQIVVSDVQNFTVLQD